MWIQLTEVNGQKIALNTDHFVAVQPYGARTKITHVGGQAIVLESPDLVLSALELMPFEDGESQDEPAHDQLLHS